MTLKHFFKNPQPQSPTPKLLSTSPTLTNTKSLPRTLTQNPSPLNTKSKFNHTLTIDIKSSSIFIRNNTNTSCYLSNDSNIKKNYKYNYLYHKKTNRLLNKNKYVLLHTIDYEFSKEQR
jgi:hypothetical protein